MYLKKLTMRYSSQKQRMAEIELGIARGYLINATALESGEHSQWMSPNVSSLVVGGLHPYYQYDLVVAAVTIGVGPFSEVQRIQIPEDGMYIKHKCFTMEANH